MNIKLKDVVGALGVLGMLATLFFVNGQGGNPSGIDSRGGVFDNLAQVFPCITNNTGFGGGGGRDGATGPAGTSGHGAGASSNAVSGQDGYGSGTGGFGAPSDRASSDEGRTDPNAPSGDAPTGPAPNGSTDPTDNRDGEFGGSGQTDPGPAPDTEGQSSGEAAVFKSFFAPSSFGEAQVFNPCPPSQTYTFEGKTVTQKQFNERTAARNEGYRGTFGGGAYVRWVNEGLPTSPSTPIISPPVGGCDGIFGIFYGSSCPRTTSNPPRTTEPCEYQNSYTGQWYNRCGPTGPVPIGAPSIPLPGIEPCDSTLDTYTYRRPYG